MVDTLDLRPEFAQPLVQLIAASHGRIWIQSGFRTDAQQAELYAKAVQEHGAAQAGNWVAPPGHSNHNKGLAADLGGDIALAHQLAPQFGLEFPMSWEDWHVEPVGLRTQSGTSAKAYVPGPPGSINPTQDPFLDKQPHTIMARLSAVLQGQSRQGTGAQGAAATGFVDDPMASTPPATTAPAAATGGTKGGTPNVALQSGGTGGDKRLPGHSITDWAKDVLTGVGAPLTPQNMDTLVTWANRESGGYNPSVAGGRYNPLNTTEGAVGFVGQGGSQGNIKDFGSYQQGVQAIVHNLTQTKGAGYENILGALRQGNDPNAVFSAINGSAFGTHF